MAGRILIALGFLMGALVSVQTAADHVRWPIYIPALLVGFAGVIVGRVGARREARDVPALQENSQRLQQSIDRVVANIRILHTDACASDLLDLHERLDRLVRDDLTLFAENRSAIQHRFGLQNYALIMNHFAAGERYLNRVWSASVDGYLDEARDYLAHARTELELASQHLNSLIAKL